MIADIPNAFAGIAQLLNLDFGPKEFFYGLPEAAFEKALRWSVSCHFPDRRRREFPSWSWMGWRWGEGQQIEFPSPPASNLEWTPADFWHRPCEDGGFSLTQSSWIDEITHHFVRQGLSRFWGLLEQQPLCYSPETMPPLPHLISTSCYVAALPIDYEGVPCRHSFGCEQYTIRSPLDLFMGHINLNRGWRRAQEATLNFLEVGHVTSNRQIYTKDTQVEVILVEVQDGIAYRVQLPVKPLVGWYDGLGQHRIVTLG